MILAGRVRRLARTSEGKHLLIVVAIGFVLRLAWGLWALRGVPEGWLINGDQYSYWYYGHEIAHGRGYVSYDTGVATSYYPVGFPALLGVVYWLGLHTPLPDNEARLTAALEIVLATASIVLVYFIGRKIANHRVGIVAAAIVAVFPSLIIGVGTYSVETTFIFTVLLCVAIAVDHDWSEPMSRRRLLWFGAALGASVLVRPFSFPVMIGLGLAAWFLGTTRRERFRSAARHVGWAMLAFLVVLTPWTIRNEVRLDAFAPISTNLGDGLCMSRYPGSNGGFAWASHPYCANPNLPEAQRNPANTKAAIRFVLHHPGEELRQIPKRYFLMMGDDHGVLAESLGNGSHLSMSAHLQSAIEETADYWYFAVLVLAMTGCGLYFIGWRRDAVLGRRKAIVGVTTLGLLFFPLMLWGNPLFHTPLLPFMALMAAGSLVWLADARQARRARRAAPPPFFGSDQPAERAKSPEKQVVLVSRTRRFVRRREARWVIVVVAAGFVLRLAWGLWAQRHTPPTWVTTGDQYGYWYYGNEIAHGRGYLSYLDHRATAYYPVGYPALLAVVYWLGLHTPFVPGNQAISTALLHTALGTASIVLVYFIGRKTFGHRAGLIAAAIVAFFPSLIIETATFSLETTFIFSALLCVAIVVDHDWANGPMSRRRLLWFGVALGCSALVRPFAVPVLIGVFIAVLLTKRDWRSALRHVGWVLVTFLLVLTPWTIRNEIRFHAFAPISTNLGDGLCMSRFPGSDGDFAWASHPYSADYRLPEAVRNPANAKAAVRFVIHHPFEELRQMPKRFFLMMAQDHDTLPETIANGTVDIEGGRRAVIDLASDYYYYAVFFLALAGLGLLFAGWRDDPLLGPRKAIVGITMAGLVIIPVELWGAPRFHIPILPFMALVAGAAIAWLVDRRQQTVATVSVER